MKRWCDECRHWSRNLIQGDSSPRFAVHTCAQPTVRAAHAHDGVIVAVLCADARRDERGCGPEGRYFEQSPEVITP